MVGIGAFIAATAIQSNQASEVLAKSLTILSRAETVVGVFTQKSDRGIGRGEFHLKKDKKLAVFGSVNSEICDGVFRTSINRKDGTCTVKDVRVFDLPYIPGFEGFTFHGGRSLFFKFSRESSDNKFDSDAKNVRMTTLERKSVVAYTIGGNNVYLDPASALPVAVDFVGENRSRILMKFEHVKLDVPLQNEMFALRPADAIEVKKVLEPGMLRVGDKMPYSNSEGMSMLTKAMDGKRNSVVLFFSDNNEANGDMLKKMYQIARKTPKDVAVIGVARTREWRKMYKGRLNFTVIEDAELPSDSIATKFGITRYPTLYVIDKNQEATYVQIGSNDNDLDSVLKGLGFNP
jgi:hypothetical protein